jgi:ferrous iron transport protein A
MTPLGFLSPGESGEIMEVRIHGHRGYCRCHNDGRECECGMESGREKEGARMDDIGFRIGKTVEMLRSGDGPVLVKIDESRIAIARGMAMKILVRRLQ